MEMSVTSYKLFWDTEHHRGGVTVALQSGAAIPLLTDRPDVLRVWAAMLLTNHAVYYVSPETSGLTTDWQEAAENRPGHGVKIEAQP